MRAPTSGPAMVGREPDLQVLRSALSDADRGVARCVALSGEAGMGKTRLLAEFRATIDSNVVVLSAECIDLGPLGVPLGPVRTVFRQLVSAVGADAVLAAAGAGVSAIVALMPELVTRVGESADGVEPLHEALMSLLAEFSRDRTIVLVIDDLQWADAATLAFVRFVLRMASNDRLLVVVAFRSDDLGRSHPLRQVLSELDRARAITRHELAALNGGQVRALVTSLRGSEPDRDAIERIVSRSQGVPFYVEELVSMGGDRLPDTLRDVLLTRYERLEPDARALLRVLAVGGIRVDHDVLTRVWRGAPLDESVRSATEEMLLVVGESEYGFRHALVREAIYGELLPGERHELHERYATALDELGAPASETSYHWFAAHDLARALSAFVTAFDEAIAARAFASALQMGERALEIWQKVPDAEARAERTRSTLLAQVVDSARDAGDHKRTLALVDVAIAARGADDRSGRARLLQLKSSVLGGEGLPGAELALLEALEVLGDSQDDLALKAGLQSALAGRYSLSGRMNEARTLLDQALETAKQSGSEDLLARILIDIAWGETVAGNIETGRALFAEARAHAGDGVEFLRYGNNVSDAFVLVGEYAAALEECEAPFARAGELGLERSWGAILSNSVDALIALGRWDEADERGDRVLAIQPSGCSIAMQHRRRIQLATWRDDTPAASAIARTHASLLRTFAAHGDLQDVLPTAATMAELALFQGDLDQAWAQVTIVWDPPHNGATGYDLPILGIAARIIGEMRRLDLPVPIDAVRNIDLAFSRLADWPIVARWRALVDAELSDPEGTGTDAAAWQAAVTALSDPSMPAHLRAYSWWRLGQAQLAAGDRASATTSLRAAAADAGRIGATWVVNRASELLSTAALGERQRGAADQLTSREEQVLDLIADGLSNREIAERLFISSKTASVHVSAILRKMGAATRTQAAMMRGRSPLDPEGDRSLV